MDPIIISTSDGGTPKYSVTPRPWLPNTPNDQVSSRINRYLYFLFNSHCGQPIFPFGEDHTTRGRSTISPKFSLRPSVTMNRRVNGFLDLVCSSLISSSTRSRSSMSLCSNHRTVDREICKPF